jgi:hypothetical protein
MAATVVQEVAVEGESWAISVVFGRAAGVSARDRI